MVLNPGTGKNMKIEIKELTKEYGSNTALDNVSLCLTDGIYGILGPNGSGKTTIINLLTDNVKRTHGEILIEGKDILSLGAKYRNQNYFDRYILPNLGGMKIKDISTVACQQFLMKMYTNGRIRNVKKKGKGLSAKTVKDIKIVLQTCLQKAEDEGLIDSNPCKKVQLPKDAPKEMQTLKANELGRFLQETKDSECYEFYILEITTGLRLGEILALTWDDLDMKNKTISVNKQVQRIGSELKVTTPKTASSIRTIALCDECFNQLILLRSRQRLDNKLIFPSPITGGLRDPSSVTRKLHRMQKRAGVPQIRFHDLRHSFATLSLEQGMDIKTISHMLGHTDAGFTMNTYMHVTNNMQQTVADAMGNLITESENERKNKFIHFSA